MQLKSAQVPQLMVVSGMQQLPPQLILVAVLGLNYNIGKLLANLSYIGS